MVGYYYETRLRDNEIRIKRQTGPEELTVSFRRTVRVPDNSTTSWLPPDLGKFPLYNAQDYASALPATTAAKFGILMPMYQREAMWIKFEANSPFAIKVYVGSVNAVSGEPALENSSTNQRRQLALSNFNSVQDYMVVPGQLWLDGIASSSGVVKQFVATRLGNGYTVEAQVTGAEAYGGLQFEITPATADTSAKRSVLVTTLSGKTINVDITQKTTGLGLKEKIEVREGIPVDQQRLIIGGKQIQDHEPVPLEQDIVHLLLGLRGGGLPGESKENNVSGHTMGIAAGGKIKQGIVRDLWPAQTWHKKATIAFNVHVLNSKTFETVTGIAAPETPITTKNYEELGLPFFKLYEEPSVIHGSFEGVKSIGEIDGVEEREYAIPTKIINPQSAHVEDRAVNKSRDPEDISNPAGPFTEFRSVSEIEQELRSMKINGAN